MLSDKNQCVEFGKLLLKNSIPLPISMTLK